MISMARVTHCRVPVRVARHKSGRKEAANFSMICAWSVYHGNAISVSAHLTTMAALVRLKRGSVQLRHAALEVRGTCALNRLPSAMFSEILGALLSQCYLEIINQRFAMLIIWSIYCINLVTDLINYNRFFCTENLTIIFCWKFEILC